MKYLEPFLFLVLSSTAATAGIDQSPTGTRGSTATTTFYVVNSDGRSVPENPLASGFAVTSSEPFNPSSPAQLVNTPGTFAATQSNRPISQARQHRVSSKRQTNSSIRIRTSKRAARKPKRDRASEYRCERHGFFYTANGRCVVPAQNRPSYRVRHQPRQKFSSKTNHRGIPEGPGRSSSIQGR